MEIKFAKIYDKYFIDDCEWEIIVGMECELTWYHSIDLEQYFYVDEKGVIYDTKNGEAVGLLTKIKEAK